jgi:hydrogenase nickel incorporation protein HypA/HybF
MHEVSIAANIVKIVGEELGKNNGKSVNKLHLEVGRLSGVVVESLRFALDVSKNDNFLKNTEIIIDEIPAKVKCRSCDFEFEADDYYVVCPKCQNFQLDFLSGRELNIKSIVIS